jgi:hypothetical protein
MHNVLVTARIFGQISDQAFDVFRKNGLKVVPNPYRGKKLSEIELIELIGGVIMKLKKLQKRSFELIRNSL